MNSEDDDYPEITKDTVRLHLVGGLFKNWYRITKSDLRKDIERLASLDAFEKAYIIARWWKLADLVLALHKVLKRYDTDSGKLDLIGQIYGEQLGLSAQTIAPDIDSRLRWYKERMAKDFEKQVKLILNFHQIKSPIEQLFLMEWSFLGVEKKYDLRLIPQAELKIGTETYKIDFVVMHTKNDNVKLAVEIDGHEFHEKTKDQAARDKRRERSITRQGYTVIRFTAAEVSRNPQKCVSEVVEIITSRTTT